MRIVGGRHRGRALKAPAGRALRPTAARAREALFDILLHGRLGGPALAGATVLDVFAGTGALGFEALSRGAAQVFALENDRAAALCLAANAEALGETERMTLIRADATRPPPAPGTANIAFLDAPYESGLAWPALAALAHGGWLASGALVIVETAAKESGQTPPPEGFKPGETRRYGAARFSFLRFIGL